MSAETVALRIQRSVNGRNWYKSVPFLTVHGLALAGVIAGAPAKVWWLCFWLYWIRMFLVTGLLHRYFAHRSFHFHRKIKRAAEFTAAALTSLTVQKGVAWWASHHRNHHANSDQPEDPHSVVQDGFWWAHVDWILSGIYDETDWSRVPDFKKPEMVWINKYHHVLPVMLGVAIFAWGGWRALFVGYFFSTVLLWHCTFFINSLAHVKIPWWLGPFASWKSHRTDPNDSSQNNFMLAIITLGEGWHNPHHAEKHVTKQGDRWWMLDVTYYALWLISLTGLIHGVTCHSDRSRTKRLAA
jgi:stearoyl-CoA desaturase (delta-9 desaturase)